MAQVGRCKALSSYPQYCKNKNKKKDKKQITRILLFSREAALFVKAELVRPVGAFWLEIELTRRATAQGPDTEK
jgi:hypothetical protein